MRTLDSSCVQRASVSSKWILSRSIVSSDSSSWNSPNDITIYMTWLATSTSTFYLSSRFRHITQTHTRMHRINKACRHKHTYRNTLLITKPLYTRHPTKPFQERQLSAFTQNFVSHSRTAKHTKQTLADCQLLILDLARTLLFQPKSSPTEPPKWMVFVPFLTQTNWVFVPSLVSLPLHLWVASYLSWDLCSPHLSYQHYPLSRSAPCGDVFHVNLLQIQHSTILLTTLRGAQMLRWVACSVRCSGARRPLTNAARVWFSAGDLVLTP